MEARIKYLRKQKGLTQSEFGEIIGVKGNTVTGYENGTRSPTNAIINSICREFGVSENWLRTGLGDMFPAKEDTAAQELARQHHLTPSAAELLRIATAICESLDEETALDILNRLRKIMEENADKDAAPDPDNVIRIRMTHYLDASAAGVPLDATSDYEYVNIPASQVPAGADFMVDICGQSMEPTIKDGSTVFVHKQESAETNDIVIAWVAGEGTVCKRLLTTATGHVAALMSDNRRFADIMGDRLKDVRIYGKVLL